MVVSIVREVVPTWVFVRASARRTIPRGSTLVRTQRLKVSREGPRFKVVPFRLVRRHGGLFFLDVRAQVFPVGVLWGRLRSEVRVVLARTLLSVKDLGQASQRSLFCRRANKGKVFRIRPLREGGAIRQRVLVRRAIMARSFFPNAKDVI